MSSIDEIKARIDIVDLVSESVQLRHSGKNYTGFCPFHPNTRTPSFVVFPSYGHLALFWAMQRGGRYLQLHDEETRLGFSGDAELPGG